MDLNSVNVQDTHDIVIIHPVTGEKTDIVITVQSYGGEKVKAIKRKIANKRMRMGRNKRLNAEDLEEEAVEVACAVWVAWKGMEVDGKEMEFTPANVKKVVTDPKLSWLVKQVDNGAAEEANFISA